MSGDSIPFDLATIHANAQFVVEIGDQKLTGIALLTANWDDYSRL
ncbi:MAG: hypothetical protein ACLQIB_34175 [Isosphaeraceae bacterium]